MKRAQLLKIEAQTSSIWAKVCMLMCVFVIRLDMTTPICWRGKSWYIIISLLLSMVVS